ncbi:hypothetical protein LCGC14_1185380 [marine sediment metagenome]|uniref:Uncharacterized protein n=1 Tax=marine sediment metagenome TaxID=412755 RepID=A0A0F9M8P9_9ZZZZ
MTDRELALIAIRRMCVEDLAALGAVVDRRHVADDSSNFYSPAIIKAVTNSTA